MSVVLCSACYEWEACGLFPPFGHLCEECVERIARILREKR